MWKLQESIESESLYWYQARVNNKCFLHNKHFVLAQNWPISIQDQNILFYNVHYQLLAMFEMCPLLVL